MGAKVRMHICGNIRKILEGIGRLGCDFVDVDSLAPLAEARQKMGPNQVLLGNLNPVTVLRNGTAAGVTAEVTACHQQAGSRFIVGAGCEVPRGTPRENIEALTRFARGSSPS